MEIKLKNRQNPVSFPSIFSKMPNIEMLQNNRNHAAHCVDNLRELSRQDSKRTFTARGANTPRCQTCLMADFACFCGQRPTNLGTKTHFTLVYHCTEIHKPTNSGRLIADLFPNNTEAFLWSRTEPNQQLLDRLNQFEGRNLILFPDTERRNQDPLHRDVNCSSSTELNIIILDATWRLASKMLHQSRWLDKIPTLAINEQTQRTFSVRHAKHDNQYATAEVVAMLLAQFNEEKQSEALTTYYNVFNQHCLWSRQRHLTPTPNTI